MNKVLVEICCPSASRNYDFWISKKMIVEKAFDLCVDEICAREKNPYLFPEKDKLVFFSQRLSCVLNKNYSVEEAGIISGDKLMIV